MEDSDDFDDEAFFLAEAQRRKRNDRVYSKDFESDFEDERVGLGVKDGVIGKEDSDGNLENVENSKENVCIDVDDSKENVDDAKDSDSDDDLIILHSSHKPLGEMVVEKRVDGLQESKIVDYDADNEN